MGKIFLIFDKNAYFYPYEDVCIFPYRNNFIIKNLLKVMIHFNLPLWKPFFSKDLIRCMYSNDIIITDTIASRSLFNYFNKKKINFYLYFMNPITGRKIEYINYLDKNKIFTFDKLDSEFYEINYLSTPYSDKIKLPSKQVTFDTCFLGRDKGRQKEILDLYLSLNNLKLKNCFKILGDKFPDKKLIIHQFINYSKYLEMIACSKCIVEILQKNQNSKSLRALEALFFRKKLITNCIAIKQEPYYHPNNIFIIGVDYFDDLIDFINKPFVCFDKCREHLAFENWLENFK